MAEAVLLQLEVFAYNPEKWFVIIANHLIWLNALRMSQLLPNSLRFFVIAYCAFLSSVSGAVQTNRQLLCDIRSPFRIVTS